MTTQQKAISDNWDSIVTDSREIESLKREINKQSLKLVHADKLAEALRHLMAITYNDNALQYKEAREALAAWEGAK